jgi:hypothetical protein
VAIAVPVGSVGHVFGPRPRQAADRVHGLQQHLFWTGAAPSGVVERAVAEHQAGAGVVGERLSADRARL